MDMNDLALAVLLGVVEGLTEFLPVSSTAHMLLVEQLVGVDLERDSFWKTFTVVIQLGAILAVVVVYAGRFRSLASDFLRHPSWRHPSILVMAAVVPAGAIGLLAKKQLDAAMEHALPIGIALIAGAIAIPLIERGRRDRDTVSDVANVTPWQALAIGFAQALALVPGVSRSAATILGGRLVGLTTRAAADFSFLLSVPTMTAAAGYSLLKHRAPISPDRWLVLAVGFVTAFAVALIVVAWFLHFVKRRGLSWFVPYRIILGLAVIAAWATGVLK